MELKSNTELDLAYNFVEFTNRNVFLTGKAGTGKTTFLHTLREKSRKRMVVVAPTGVAAINAKGVTIHSFFQMPFGIIAKTEKSYSGIIFIKNIKYLRSYFFIRTIIKSQIDNLLTGVDFPDKITIKR